MAMIYDNPWRDLVVKEYPKSWMKYMLQPIGDYMYSYLNVNEEFLLPDGRIVTGNVRLASEGSGHEYRTLTDRVRYWDKGEEKIYPIEEVKFRYEDKKYQKVRTLLDLIQVGDFVKAKSRAGDYRKVQKIEPFGAIYGQAYAKPIDDDSYARYVSSQNSMVHISQVWRDEKKIWGK